MRGVLDFLAARRWAGVGLAAITELLLLVALARAPGSDVVGLQAAVAASIGGTVAVVFGVVDGVAVALAGAVVFAALGDWKPGELATLAVWPAMVGAAGLFARRVNRHRAALRSFLATSEEEKRALAQTLHDQSAQTLAAALMTLRVGGDEADQARELIANTIRELRGLAVDLSPKALDDYGLHAALSTLAEVVSARTQIAVRVTGDWDARLSAEAERALFRFAQAALSAAIERVPESVDIALNSEGDRVVLTVSERGGNQPTEGLTPPEPTSAHLQALGARLSTMHSPTVLVFRAELPLLAFAR